jgi:hypothetical protein
MVGCYEACKQQPLMPNVNRYMPGLMNSDKAVFTLFEMACSEGQARRCTLTTIRHLSKCGECFILALISTTFFSVSTHFLTSPVQMRPHIPDFNNIFMDACCSLNCDRKFTVKFC